MNKAIKVNARYGTQATALHATAAVWAVSWVTIIMLLAVGGC